jgi:hypothetical protein
MGLGPRFLASGFFLAWPEDWPSLKMPRYTPIKKYYLHFKVSVASSTLPKYI